ARVSTPLNPWRPRLTVYQIDDWHLVPRETFPSETAWRLHLNDVETVQRERVPVLKLLASRGIRVGLLEGMTPEDAEAWDRSGRMLKAQEADQRNVRENFEYSKGRLRLAKNANAQEAARKAMRLADELLQQHREQMLEMGAPCRALITGVDLDARPLEEAA